LQVIVIALVFVVAIIEAAGGVKQRQLDHHLVTGNQHHGIYLFI
jgi:hypothetical protein